MEKKNIYMPMKARISRSEALSRDVKLFELALPERFDYLPGQFVMLSLWGKGEVPISITSTPGRSEGIEVCVRAVGQVTSAITSLSEGDTLWVRGPYGRPFPTKPETADILIVTGGIGIVPLRPLIELLLSDRKSYRHLDIIYGSRNPSEVLFAEEASKWEEKGAKLILTVDTCDTDDWKGCTGVVTDHLGKAEVDFKDCTAYICGPPPMIQASMRDLSLMGMPDERIITTLEAHMKCGVGKCGHCYSGGRLICDDGPVFTYEEIKRYNLRPGMDLLD